MQRFGVSRLSNKCTNNTTTHHDATAAHIIGAVFDTVFTSWRSNTTTTVTTTNTTTGVWTHRDVTGDSVRQLRTGHGTRHNTR